MSENRQLNDQLCVNADGINIITKIVNITWCTAE